MFLSSRVAKRKATDHIPKRLHPAENHGLAPRSQAVEKQEDRKIKSIKASDSEIPSPKGL